MKKRYKFWFGAVAALVVLIALLLVLQLLRMDVNAFAERYKNSLWTIPIVVFLYLLKAVTMVFLPQPLVYLITGLLFSPLVAFLVTVRRAVAGIYAGLFSGPALRQPSAAPAAGSAARTQPYPRSGAAVRYTQQFRYHRAAAADAGTGNRPGQLYRRRK